MIQAAIFDMDGLLIDSEPFWDVATTEAFDSVGVKRTHQEMDQTRGIGLAEVIAYWYHKQPWEGRSQKDIEAYMIDRVIKQVRENGQALPGVLDTLDLFSAQGIPMAVASSSPVELIDVTLERLGIRDRFEFAYSADHEQFAKPHPGVFISSATKLNVPVHRCLVFEDAPNGVIAAKAAKMLCIAVPDPKQRRHRFIQTADAVLDTLLDFNEQTLDSLRAKV